MLALQIHRYNNANLSPKDALREHIDHLSLDKQREFIAAALQLIVSRTAKETLDTTANYATPLLGR